MIENKIKVLHILTLVDNKGEYGGPLRVARELIRAMDNNNKFSFKIVGGSTGRHYREEKSETRIFVRKWFPTKSVSGFFSIKMLSALRSEIRSSDILHLHFARDLIQFFAVIVALIYKKPYITQTHGMIRQKPGKFVRMLDFLITRQAIKFACYNFALNIDEEKELIRIQNRARIIQIPNGIAYDTKDVETYQGSETTRLIFCSRISPDKGLELLKEIIINLEKLPMIKLDIYGPDGGSLFDLLYFLQNNSITKTQYKGTLSRDDVAKELIASDLLLLPSKYDPFPMITLESLSLGLPILISPECGNSAQVRSICPEFVACDNTKESYLDNIRLLQSVNFYRSDRNKIKNVSKRYFDIYEISKQVEKAYIECKDAKRGSNF